MEIQTTKKNYQGIETEYFFIFEVIEKDGDKKSIFERYLNLEDAKRCARTWNKMNHKNKTYSIIRQPVFTK